jgi:tetratricopeptide (TPR) repeat protein
MKSKKINWFDFKESRISGWGYLGRSILGYFLLILIIPGFWLLASTAYKRARALDWSKEFSIVASVLMCILWPLNILTNGIGVDSDFSLFIFPLQILHLIMLFKNGNKNLNKNFNNNNKSNLSSADLNKKNEDLNVVDKIVESSTSKTDAISKCNDNNNFNVNIETSWGGEEPSILTFFKKYISVEDKLELNNQETFKNNTFYAKEESNEKGHIFIFFEEAEEAIVKFKGIVKPHSNNDLFFKLKSKQISSWISQYKSEIQCLSIQGCSIQLSKGVNLYRIDISIKDSFTWATISSVNLDKALIFTYPFSSPIENNISNIEFNFDLSESVMIASTYFNIIGNNNLKIPVYDGFYGEDELKVFSHTEDFKSFWNFCCNHVFVDKIDPLQSEIFKNIFQKIDNEFSLFDKLNLSFQFLQSSQQIFITIDNIDLKDAAQHLKYCDRNQELLRINKYYGIQDGEFILFSMMKNRMDEVEPYLDNFKDLEDLFSSMKNESNELAVELRKKLVGDLPLNLIDRPTDIKVAQDDDITPTSNYSKKIIENYNSAMQKLQSGNYNIAANELEEVLKHDKYMLPAYYNLTVIKINFEQDYDGAIKILDHIINIQGYNKNPDIVYAGLFFNRGLAKSYLELEEDAIKDFNEALKIDPEHIPSYGSRGLSLMHVNKKKEALGDFNKAIELGDKSYIIYANRGRCKQSLADFSGALEDYNLAYEIDPENDNINSPRNLLLAMKESGLMDQFDNVLENTDEKTSIGHEKISYIFEILIRISMADNKLDESETALISKSISKLRDTYDFQGEIKRPESLSFLSKVGDIFSDEEKATIITLVISLIYADDSVTYSELSLAIAISLAFELSIEKAEELISSICVGQKLDENTFYLYLTQIFSKMKSEIPELNEKDTLIIEKILKIEEDEVSNDFKLLSENQKLIVFSATIFYDQENWIRSKSDELNSTAWDKMERGDYDSALIDAKKSIDIMSTTNNNDTIALIYFHLKKYTDAKKFIDISIDLDPSISDHYVTRAKIHSKLDKVDLAKSDLIKAIELNPENEEANSFLDSFHKNQ